jgi:DNA-binding response OmpR family regulator
MATALAPTKITEKIETEVEIQRDELVKVLIVDDEKPIRDGWERLFRENGFDTDTARDPEQAQSLLKDNKYEIVIVDILFEKLPVTGDQFIVENINLMKSATVVVVTGNDKNQIQKLDQLKNLGIEILGKGEVARKLLQIINEKLEERKGELAKIVGRMAGYTVRRAITNEDFTVRESDRTMFDASRNKYAVEYLVNELQKTLVNWFRTRQEPDKKSIVYGNRVFSANELANEVEHGTEIGREHLEGMIEVFKECLNIKL